MEICVVYIARTDSGFFFFHPARINKNGFRDRVGPFATEEEVTNAVYREVPDAKIARDFILDQLESEIERAGQYLSPRSNHARAYF